MPPMRNSNHREFELALQLSMKYHEGQVDKQGEPYILHSVRVAMRLEGPLLRSIGVLHDVLEDCRPEERRFVVDDIHIYLGESVLSYVKMLTRGEEKYEDYITMLAPEPIARKVKLADLADNLDPDRWKRGWTPPGEQRQRYLWAQWYLRRAEIHGE